jgi:hypothetical protein
MRRIVLASVMVATGCSADAQQEPKISDTAREAMTAARRMVKRGDVEALV